MVDRDNQGLDGREFEPSRTEGEDRPQSRGEAFDEQQGGGRGPDSLSPEDEAEDFQLDLDPDQAEAERESE